MKFTVCVIDGEMQILTDLFDHQIWSYFHEDGGSIKCPSLNIKKMQELLKICKYSI